MYQQFISSESVTEGHPDKLCDQISDGILDAILTQDPNSRVAAETLTTTGLIVVAGEVTTTATIDVQQVVRDVVRKTGYDSGDYGFDADQCAVLISMHEQSPDIAMGVNEGEGLHDSQGAGDQGIMFGYASNETEQLMPLPITLAHQLTQKLAEVRKQGILDRVRPDGKSQVTVEYRDGKPVRVDAVIISTQHSPDVEHQEIYDEILEKVINPICKDWVDEDTTYYINPTGKFVVGGPHGDAGVTGRKIIVDTYGGIGRHGGGAFSGKDPSKVDRSATYMARYLAKNIVASGVCDKCEIQLSYAIGVAEPVSIHVDCFGTEKVELDKIVEATRTEFDLSPAGIIAKLDLKRPIYQETASYGHFGRDIFSREQTDSTDAYSKLLS